MTLAAIYWLGVVVADGVFEAMRYRPGAPMADRAKAVTALLWPIIPLHVLVRAFRPIPRRKPR